MEKRPNALPDQQEKDMDRSTTYSVPRITTILALLALLVGLQASAQVPLNSDGSPVEALGAVDEKYAEIPYESDIAPLTATELETLVGPIALYPDDLLAIVLPASTYPLQIVQAARFLEAYKIDSTLEPDEAWDESVIALINYPEVIQLLNDDIDWTWQLGEAVISQQENIVAAVESFRDRAYVAGNLKSDEYQTVSREDDIIEIVPIEDDVIYVPYYEPERVVVYQPQPVYHYYARPYPVYYYPYPTGHSFYSGYFWGVTTAFRIGWATDHLHVHHASYWGHPYYGHHYYGHYYRRPSITVYNTVYVDNARRHSAQRYRDGDYWRPHRRAGARQSDYYAHTRHYRNDVQRVRNSSNSTGTSRRRSNTSTTTRRSTFTSSDRDRQQRLTTTANNDRRLRTATTSSNDRRQRPAATTSNVRRQQPATSSNDSRRERTANVNRDERRSAASNVRTRRAQPETRHVARNTSNDRRQSAQRSQRSAATNNSARSSQERPAQRQPPRSQPSRSQKQSSAQPERASAQRSTKSEGTQKRSRPERSSSRKERRTH
jgi:hypothetical protein